MTFPLFLFADRMPSVGSFFFLISRFGAGTARCGPPFRLVLDTTLLVIPFPRGLLAIFPGSWGSPLAPFEEDCFLPSVTRPVSQSDMDSLSGLLQRFCDRLPTTTSPRALSPGPFFQGFAHRRSLVGVPFGLLFRRQPGYPLPAPTSVARAHPINLGSLGPTFPRHPGRSLFDKFSLGV